MFSTSMPPRCGSPIKYTEHFRNEALRRVKNGDKLSVVSKDLTIPPSTLRKWVNKYKKLNNIVDENKIERPASSMLTRSKTPGLLKTTTKPVEEKQTKKVTRIPRSVVSAIFGRPKTPNGKRRKRNRKSSNQTSISDRNRSNSPTPSTSSRPQTTPILNIRNRSKSPSIRSPTPTKHPHMTRSKVTAFKCNIVARVCYDPNNIYENRPKTPMGPIYRPQSVVAQTSGSERVETVTLESSDDEDPCSRDSSPTRSMTIVMSPVSMAASLSDFSDDEVEISAPKDAVGSGEQAWPAQNNIPSPGPSRKPAEMSQQQPRPSTSRKPDSMGPRPSTSTSAGYIKPEPGTPPTPMMMHHSHGYMDTAPPVQPPPPMQPAPQPRLLPKPNPMQQQQAAPMRSRLRPPPPPQPPPEDNEPQQVCLRWNSFHDNLQTMFPSLLNREKFVDVTLACEGRSIKCHKVVLSSCSAYLERLLSENPCKHPIILMPRDLKFWELRSLVDFMYCGEVNVEHEKLGSLLSAAEALQIKGLAGPSSSLPDQEEEQEQRPLSPRVKRKRTASPAPPPVRHHAPPPPPVVAPPPVHRMPVSPPRVVASPPLLPNSSSVSITRLNPRSQQAANVLPVRARSPQRLSDIRANSPGIEITPLVSFEEIKMEPIDISDSNDESMDPMDPMDNNQDYDMDKDYAGGDDQAESGGEEEEEEDDDDDDRGGGEDISGFLDTGNHNGESHDDNSSANPLDDQQGSDLPVPPTGYPENETDFGLNLEQDPADPPDLGSDLNDDPDLPLSSDPGGEPPDDDAALMSSTSDQPEAT